MYYAEGVKYHQLGKYNLALKNYETALKIDPASVKTLLKRSKAYVELQEYTMARKDAMTALDIAPSSSAASLMKGRCEYLMGDFERGFRTFSRGLETNPGSKKLRLCRQLCEETIMNSMRQQSDEKINDRDLKSLRDWKKNDCSRVFRRYSEDKKLFEDILMDEDMKNVHVICKDGLNFIDKSEQCFRMQNPKHIRKKPSLKRQPIPSKNESLIQYISSIIRRCKNYLQRELASHCISECLKLLKFFDSHPESLSHGKIKFKADVVHLQGLAYEMKKEDSTSLKLFENELELAKSNNLVHCELRAFHHLGRLYVKQGKLAKACDCVIDIQKSLNSNQMINYYNEYASSYVNETVKGDDNAELVEIKDARVWAQNFKYELRATIKTAVIEPVEQFLIDIYNDELRTMHVNDSVMNGFEFSQSIVIC
ncbi:hypothetical protein JTE90_008423 [Oedothorax gibbosus]|uniref:Outer dynein arm-docking complex subunit 4 n=1 Tax=Oedothorax gibbosus TaxID=931172 RepID=A0AAV6UT65_9ARAC|nr:hypothetical protein JTE90_008423 [Oedothorax gibbosus]